MSPTDLDPSFALRKLLVDETSAGLRDLLRAREPRSELRIGDLDPRLSVPELFFTRSRQVTLPWKILGGGTGWSSEVEILLDRIEASWEGTERRAAAGPRLWISGSGAHFLQSTSGGAEPVPPERVVLQHGREVGAFYLVEPPTLTEREFREDYDGAWTKVTGLISVFPDHARSLEGLDRVLHEVRRLPTGSALTRFRDVFPPPREASRSFAPGDLQGELEASWGIGISEEVLRRNVTQAGEPGAAYWSLDANKLLAKDGAIPSVPAAAIVPVEKGTWILRWGERHYRVLLRQGVDLDLRIPAQYRKVRLEDAIEALELVARSSTDKPPERLPFPLTEEIDARPHLIVQEYRELAATEELNDGFDKLAESLVKGIAERADLTAEEIDVISQRYRDLKTRALETRRRIDVLQERARRLGYFLALADKQGEDGESVPMVRKGLLYRRVQRSVTVRRKVGRRKRVAGRTGLFGLTRKIRWESVYKKVTETVIGYQEVPLETELWQHRRGQWEEAGFLVHVFELANGGYSTADGARLVDIMRVAAGDEDFRQRLVLFLPLYGRTGTGGMTAVRYLIIAAPLPGIEALSLPAVYFEEELTYLLDYRGTEVGALLHSINLAPGEKRRISVQRTLGAKREDTQTVHSVSDVTRSRTDDIASSIDRTMRRERTNRSTFDWDVKMADQVSGQYEIFTFEGSNSRSVAGSSAKTATDFAEQVKKLAHKTTREIKESRKLSITTTTSLSSSFELVETSSSEIENINQGRTLNLLFHEINNIYRGAVVLNGLRLVVVPSTELVDGTGIVEPLTFQLGELGDFLAVVADDPVLSAGLGTDRDRAQVIALRTLIDQLVREYVEAGPAGETAELLRDVQAEGPSSCGAFCLAAETTLAAGAGDLRRLLVGPDTASAAAPPSDLLAEELRLGKALVQRLVPSERPVAVAHFLEVPSGAAYLDVMLGVVPATEDYSEEMRVRELALRDGEVAGRQASADLTRAMAQRMSALGQPPVALREPMIATRQLEGEGRRLVLGLSAPLPAGTWVVVLEGEVVGVVERTGEAMLRPIALIRSLNTAEAERVRLVDGLRGVAIDSAVRA